MFIHPPDDYDFFIRMDTAALPRYAQHIDSSLSISGKYANLPRDDSTVLRAGLTGLFTVCITI
jgi:hypothetical protein